MRRITTCLVGVVFAASGCSESSKGAGSTRRAAQPSFGPTFVLEVEFFTAGFCSAPCNGSLSIRSAIGDARPPVTLRLLELGGRSIAIQNAGTMTVSGVKELAAIVDRLVGSDLLDSYPGCGAACDATTVTIRARPAGSQSPLVETVYSSADLQETPHAVRDAHRFIRILWRSLDECRSGRLVTVPPSCRPPPSWPERA